ncbi:hypothetical protein J2S43_003094 [Catenuloplanes nepalensis]|uniref:Uncharacterized protein n=1 Tax=Catenuloplanes nepalensis TaxID=587533 RepID=A0ABT9MT22_9ACTN|nr:hypothetical protein [Catenuloplanes nepalensis]MDP9794582.1 hypothetical protein [Catenuloplanes nepalensis]
MEPVTAAALAATVVPLATGAAGEPGTAAWAALTEFADRHDVAGPELDAVEDAPGDPARVAGFADALAALSARDPQAAAWLRDWLADADRIVDVPHLPQTFTDPVSGSLTQPQA